MLKYATKGEARQGAIELIELSDAVAKAAQDYGVQG